MKEIKLTRKPGMPVFNEINEEQLKHEEIKQLAEKIYLYTIHFLPRKKVFNVAELPHCWQLAEDFYNFAKEKEEYPVKCSKCNEGVPKDNFAVTKTNKILCIKCAKEKEGEKDA